MVAKDAVFLLVLGAAGFMMSGCVKDFALYDNGKVLPMTFYAGFDMHGGANGVDAIDNRRATVLRDVPKPARGAVKPTRETVVED